MRLILVRHAEPAEEARGRCYGTLDVGLSERGRAQCAQLADRLAGEVVDEVVASPRRRARETAEAVAAPHGLAVETIDALREIDFGQLEGRAYDDVARDLPELFERWMRTPTSVRFPGGESFQDLRERTRHVVETLRATRDGQTVVAVTHGGVVRTIVADCLGVPDERVFRVAVDPASITRIDWLEGTPIVREVNGRLRGSPSRDAA